MQIETVTILNFRAMRHAEISISSLTGLVGSNNAGKSTILKAIELFFEAAPKLTKEDFSAGNETDPIEITITFAHLTPTERTEFGSAVIDGKMTVTRQFSLEDKDTGQYFASALVFPGFQTLRAETNGAKRLAAYRTLRNDHAELSQIRTAAEIDPALASWEATHKDELEAKRVRGFFGAPNVANGKLRKKTAVHVVPAVRDAAAETADPKRSPIISLMSDVAKQTFENKKEISDFLAKAKVEFEELADPGKIPQLASISTELTNSIKRFYADSKLEAFWVKGQGVNVEYPVPRIVVDHGGVSSDLGRVGHGLQRAALFAIVQFLAEQRAVNEAQDEQKQFDEAESDIIVLVEEPEIYQHPSKQIVIFNAFKSVTDGHNKETGIRIQLIYTTHSEKFIQMSDFDRMRLVKRVQENSGIENVISSLTIAQCSREMAGYLDPPPEPMSDDAFIAKLHIFGREVCEGFFADKIILVEGVTDKAILEAAYQACDRDPHQEAIAIIALDGKSKMDKPAHIFSAFGIPTFLVFDNDANKKGGKQNTKTNILLQKVCGVTAPADVPEGCAERFAALNNDLESYIATEMGSDYDKLMQPIAEEYGLTFDQIKKTPAAVYQLIVQATESGHNFALFEEIISKVDALS